MKRESLSSADLLGSQNQICRTRNLFSHTDVDKVLGVQNTQAISKCNDLLELVIKTNVDETQPRSTEASTSLLHLAEGLNLTIMHGTYNIW